MADELILANSDGGASADMVQYDQSVLAGPPFSVTGDEVNRCYGGGYRHDALSPASTCRAV